MLVAKVELEEKRRVGRMDKINGLKLQNLIFLDNSPFLRRRRK
jgi:hypothetical protein